MTRRRSGEPLSKERLGEITGLDHRQHDRHTLEIVAHSGRPDGYGLCDDPLYCPVCKVPMEDEPLVVDDVNQPQMGDCWIDAEGTLLLYSYDRFISAFHVGGHPFVRPLRLISRHAPR